MISKCACARATVWLCLIWLAPHAFALPVASYSINKSFEVDITDENGVSVGGPGTGGYRYVTHAFGSDVHSTSHDHDSPQTGAVLTGTVHKWTPVSLFDQLGIYQFGPFPSNAMTTHTASNSMTDMLYLGSAVGGFGLGSIVVSGEAKITSVPEGVGEVALADAFSAGDMSMLGKITAASILVGKKLIQITLGHGRYSLQSIGNATRVANPATPASAPPVSTSGEKPDPKKPPGAGRATAHDPLSVSIYDPGSGLQIAREEIFSDTWQVAGTAGISFDPGTGLSLQADSTSQASLRFTTPSSWVLNPFHGAAEIVNGVFAATGDLAMLPWLLSTVDGVTTASLLAGDIDLNFEFMVEASGLGAPTNDLLVVVANDAQGFAEVVASAPEPGNLPLVLTGLMALSVTALRRRRLGVATR